VAQLEVRVKELENTQGLAHGQSSEELANVQTEYETLKVRLSAFALSLLFVKAV
jgi:hypothetical protein